MTHTKPTRQQATKVNASRPRRVALSRSRRHGILLAYDGITEAYVRGISSRTATRLDPSGACT